MWGMTSWCMGEDGTPLLFDTIEDAEKKADELNARAGRVNSFTSYFAGEYPV